MRLVTATKLIALFSFLFTPHLIAADVVRVKAICTVEFYLVKNGRLILAESHAPETCQVKYGMVSGKCTINPPDSPAVPTDEGNNPASASHCSIELGRKQSQSLVAVPISLSGKNQSLCKYAKYDQKNAPVIYYKTFRTAKGNRQPTETVYVSHQFICTNYPY